jgi:hypothetical protein
MANRGALECWLEYSGPAWRGASDAVLGSCLAVRVAVLGGLFRCSCRVVSCGLRFVDELDRTGRRIKREIEIWIF